MFIEGSAGPPSTHKSQSRGALLSARVSVHLSAVLLSLKIETHQGDLPPFGTLRNRVCGPAYLVVGFTREEEHVRKVRKTYSSEGDV